MIRPIAAVLLGVAGSAALAAIADRPLPAQGPVVTVYKAPT
jgi:hypothetical protein